MGAENAKRSCKTRQRILSQIGATQDRAIPKTQATVANRKMSVLKCRQYHNALKTLADENAHMGVESMRELAKAVIE